MTNGKGWLAVAFWLGVGVLGGCRGKEAPAPQASEPTPSVGSAAAAAVAPAAVAQRAGVTNRKIVRLAELELEVAAPGTTQTAIERLAERHGGYVISALRNTDNGSAVVVNVTVTVRVPQAELLNAIAEVKQLGRGVGSERITSDDVTDEYVDLAARSASQKQLEQQYLELLKRAGTIKDAMEVQKVLAEVRTEIERMEGRQRLLEKESAFSTLSVRLTTAVPQLAAAGSGFSSTLRRAWSDALSSSTDTVTGAIRLLGFLLPPLLLIVLPASASLWGARRLARRRRGRGPGTIATI